MRQNRDVITQEAESCPISRMSYIDLGTLTRLDNLVDAVLVEPFDRMRAEEALAEIAEIREAFGNRAVDDYLAFEA